MGNDVNKEIGAVNDTRIPKALRLLVRRPAFKDGEPAGTREIPAKEVFDWSESERTVTIITVDGHRFSAPKTSTGKAAPAADPAGEEDPDETGGEA